MSSASFALIISVVPHPTNLEGQRDWGPPPHFAVIKLIDFS